jgi:uncharacterized membrane protein
MPVMRGRAGRSTDRLEAFTDGVIAIAITLLTLDLHVPLHGDAVGDGQVWRALLDSWPNFAAFLMSFVVVGIIWINHHTMFTHIKRTDSNLVLYNTFFLLTVSVLPFTTALLAEYLGHDGERAAVLVYNGWFILVALAFNLLWRHSRSAGLRDAETDSTVTREAERRALMGIPIYTALFLIALISPMISIIGTGVMAFLYALPNGAGAD